MKSENGLFGETDLEKVPLEYREDILTLASMDGQAREKARDRLAAEGSSILEYIEPLLKSDETHVRWEAVKTMAQVADPGHVKPLIEVFGDPDPSVRWIAAEAVINSGKEGLKTILESFIKSPDSHYFKQAVHHIVNEIKGINQTDEAKELLNTIDDNLDTVLSVPAEKLLRKL